MRPCKRTVLLPDPTCQAKRVLSSMLESSRLTAVGCVNSVPSSGAELRAVESSAPLTSEELVLALVALLPTGPLPAAARLASPSLGGLQGARDRRSSASGCGASSADGSS